MAKGFKHYNIHYLFVIELASVNLKFTFQYSFLDIIVLFFMYLYSFCVLYIPVSLLYNYTTYQVW